MPSAVNQPDPPKEKRLRSRGLQFARTVLLFYLIALLLLMIFETYLVYPIPPVTRADWQPSGLGHEDVRFTAADGTKLHGWFFPYPNSRRAILYLHGNAEQVADNGHLMAHLRDELAASVFIFDYRGYGQSEGRPDEPGCIADGRAAQLWLANRMGLEPDQIILMGRSLGGGVAVALAAELGAQALILENAFPSAVDVAAAHFPWVPVRWLMKNRYDSVARIKNYRGPLLQCQAAADTLVPLELARRLFDAAPGENRRFVEIAGAGHNDPWPDDYYPELARFLDALPPPTPAD